jgi:hypothetical protein
MGLLSRLLARRRASRCNRWISWRHPPTISLSLSLPHSPQLPGRPHVAEKVDDASIGLGRSAEDAKIAIARDARHGSENLKDTADGTSPCRPHVGEHIDDVKISASRSAEDASNATARSSHHGADKIHHLATSAGDHIKSMAHTIVGAATHAKDKIGSAFHLPSGDKPSASSSANANSPTNSPPS